ncbi:allantoinase [Paracoccus sp. J56]|nr:allantoinase [Paracoccus sp. J56]
MAEFDTVLTGRVILTGDEQPGSFVAIRDGRIAMID